MKKTLKDIWLKYNQIKLMLITQFKLQHSQLLLNVPHVKSQYFLLLCRRNTKQLTFIFLFTLYLLIPFCSWLFSLSFDVYCSVFFSLFSFTFYSVVQEPFRTYEPCTMWWRNYCYFFSFPKIWSHLSFYGVYVWK